MTCRELADFLMDYVSGELPPDVRARFEQHLSLCPNCVNYVAGYKATIALGRRAFERDETDASLQAPDDLVQAILAARRK